MEATLSKRAFTLIEFIGVMAVVALLASAAAPVVIKRLDRAAWTKEIGDLAAIRDALNFQIVRNYAISNETGWASAAAQWLNKPVVNITANSRNYNRFYLIDPNLTLPGSAGLTYIQNGNLGLTNRPSNARLMLVSVIARTNPPVVSGNSISSANFNDVWNTPSTSKPSSWSSWPGTADDICIQRLNLEPLFYQLILVNRDPGSTNASFAINGASPTVVANNSAPLNKYYLDGSAVRLYSWSGTSNALSTTYILKRNISFVFENGAWNGQISDCFNCTNPPPPVVNTNLAATFNATAVSFFNALWNSDTSSKGAKGASQSAVISSFANFMLDYTMWADTSPYAFETHGVSPPNQVPINIIMGGELGNVNTYTGNGNWGLLYNK